MNKKTKKSEADLKNDSADPNQRAKSIFLTAIELPAEQRYEHIIHSCGNDASLLREVKGLLDSHKDQSGSILNIDFGQVVVQELSTGESNPVNPDSDGIGRYELGRELGRGGCAVVFHGKQTSPVRRDVAIKMLRERGNGQTKLLERFRFEQQTQALMDHPNIARVLDAGETQDGQPFLVMELVEGMRITTYCDGHRLTIRERLSLFLDVCHGVHHAHQKGIIHRDLKPSNVLVTDVDQAPVAKVIDFGVAKAIGDVGFNNVEVTQTGQLIGSPAYMSPEQISSGKDIDIRSDVYSLGVLLYELLSGKHPYTESDLVSPNYVDLGEMIKHVEPRSLSEYREGSRTDVIAAAKSRNTDERRLSATLKEDLNWITMKCLAKDRDRRYASVNGLAADIQRYLEHEPVVAGPPSIAYRASRFVRRNRGGVIAASLILLALLLGLIGTTTGMYYANWEREQAVIQKNKANAERSRAEQVESLARQTIRNIALGTRQSGTQHTSIVMRSLNDMSSKLERGEVKDGLTEARVRFLLGGAYLDLLGYEEAEQQFQKCAALIKDVSGTDNYFYLDSLNLLAGAIKRQKRFEEALEIYIKVKAGFEKTLPEEHEAHMHLLANLATTYGTMGETEKAANHFRMALEQCEKFQPPDLNDELKIKYGFARFLWKNKQHNEALTQLIPLLQQEIEENGTSHPQTMRCRLALVENFRLSGQIHEALRYAQEMCDIDAQLNQPHPVRLLSLCNLLFETKDFEAARASALIAISVAKESSKERISQFIDRCDEELAALEDGTPNQENNIQ